MSKTRPYEFVPTYALAILIDHYELLVKSGFFKLQYDLDLMKEEFTTRITLPDDKQISIDDYIRSRNNDKWDKRNIRWFRLL